jgi:hypothetical protein
MMRRLLLDTNVYGLLAADNELFRVREAYNQKKRDYPIYGCSLIRNELRATPKGRLHLGRNLRVAMLSLYDELVGNHHLAVELNKLRTIAEKYHEIYKKLGGNKPKRSLLTDYMIVALGAVQGMDVIVSHDHATMLAEWSLRSYELVNTVLELKNPQFLDYIEFKEIILR